MADEHDDTTKEELYDKAQELDIDGRSTMDKAELAEAVAEAEAEAEAETESDQTEDTAEKTGGGFRAQTVADGHGQAQAGFTPEPGPEAHNASEIKTVSEEYEEQNERRQAREAEIEEIAAKAKRTPY